MKLRLLQWIPLLLITACQSNKEKSSQSPHLSGARPNIVFILADDLGYGDLGCYGQNKIRTPNIDALAEKGVRFTDFYAGATVCAPSRSVLMTGQHTGHTRVRGNFADAGGHLGYKGDRLRRRMNLLDEDTTVAGVLSDAGYRTCLSGKWHIGGYNPDAGPLDRGFNEFYGNRTYTSNEQRPTYWPPKWHRMRDFVDLPQNRDGKKGYYKTDLITDEAIDFIRRSKNQPFYVFVSYSNPHSPFDAPEPLVYVDEEWPLEEKIYASQIHHLDKNVGRIIRTLDELGIRENTLTLFASDNGARSEAREDQTRVVEFFNSNGPLHGYKRDMYDGGIRVPCIVSWPGTVPEGKTSGAIWYFADFLPTAADLAGARIPSVVDGISVLPVFKDPEATLPERYLYWEIFEGGFRQAVRRNNWKAIRRGLDGELELYNLEHDIGEEQNVAAMNPDIVMAIEAYLETARTDSENYIIKD